MIGNPEPIPRLSLCFFPSVTRAVESGRNRTGALVREHGLLRYYASQRLPWRPSLRPILASHMDLISG